MNSAEDVLETAADALSSQGKIAPATKKKRVLPIVNALDLLRRQVTEARKAEQDKRRQEKYEEWMHGEQLKLLSQRLKIRPAVITRIEERKNENKIWEKEEEWARWVKCSHLPDARSESDLNDYLTDWERDQSNLNLKKAVEESGMSISVMVQCQQLLFAQLLRLDKLVRAKEERMLISSLRPALSGGRDMIGEDIKDQLGAGGDEVENVEADVAETEEEGEADVAQMEDADFYAVSESEREVLERISSLSYFQQRTRMLCHQKIDKGTRFCSTVV